jgi:hypothetical protein
MTLDFNLSTIIQVVTLVGIAFAVYRSFQQPQQKSEVTDAVFDTKFNALSETVINLRDNHLHTLESKLDKHIQENQMVAIETTRTLAKIETLLEQYYKK